ncbi:MAG TPA: 50S ribosomal protein L5 [Candidatus Saccharimonadales bacterium]|nr:50S ribosomal protein L5 [Candidatus Saccharimonadales bacterium]
MNRLHKKYNEEVRPALMKELGYTNVHQIPRIEKVVINAGVGRATADSKHLETVGHTVAKISGQAPVQTVAKKSIAGFKLRDGNKIGVMVTLRGERMYAFLDRLVSVALPRIRDFRGLSEKAFDRQGNYSIGVREQSIFPELSFEETSTPHSLQVNIITTADKPEDSRKLLELMGFPFRRQNG